MVNTISKEINKSRFIFLYGNLQRKEFQILILGLQILKNNYKL